MSADPVLRVVLLAAVLLGGALGWATLARRQSAAARHWGLFAAAAASLVLPLLVLALPPLHVALLPASASAPHATATHPGATGPEAVDWGTTTLLAVWALGAFALGLRMAYGWLTTRRLVREAREVTAPKVTSEARAAAEELGLERTFAVRTHPAVRVPAVWGWWRPVVLLPPQAPRWSVDRLRAVLLHELAHIQRDDCATQWIGELTRALYWFLPPAWGVERRMRREREIACDDHVLARGARPSGYARLLVRTLAGLAPRARGRAPVAAFMTGSDIEARVRALVGRAAVRSPVRAGDRLGTVLLALLFAVPLAAAEPVARTADPAGPQQAAVVEGTETAQEKPEETRELHTVPGSSVRVDGDGFAMPVREGRSTRTLEPGTPPSTAPTPSNSTERLDRMARRVVREVVGVELPPDEQVAIGPDVSDERVKALEPHLERVAADLLRKVLSGELDVTREGRYVLDDPELARVLGNGKPVELHVARPAVYVLGGESR